MKTMALLTFKGGIHPYDGKDLAKDKAIQPLKPKGELVYLCSQHIGAPAKPIVAVGDHVLKGQKIAETVLHLYGLSDYFDAIVGMDPEETFTKCKTIRLAMELTGVTGAVLMVGDSEYDAVGAAQAGVDFVGAVYGFGISETETRFQLIHNPEQLLDLLL